MTQTASVVGVGELEALHHFTVGGQAPPAGRGAGGFEILGEHAFALRYGKLAPR